MRPTKRAAGLPGERPLLQSRTGVINEFWGHITSLRDMSAPESGKRRALAPLHGAFCISGTPGSELGPRVSQQGLVATPHRCAI